VSDITTLFGKLDASLKRYDTLYITLDGFLSLLANRENGL